MSISNDRIDLALRTISRRSRLFEIFPEESTDYHVSCLTSSSMPFVLASSKGIQVYWDKRYFALLYHATVGLLWFDKSFELPSSKAIGRFHLDSVLWTALAERALNATGQDLPLALGMLKQESMYYSHSLEVLGAYSPEFRVEGFPLDYEFELFKAFSLGHELAHVDLKMGEKLNDNLMDVMTVSLKMLDQRLEKLQQREAARPEVIAMIASTQSIRRSKTLFEEVLADVSGADSVMNALHAAFPKFADGLSIWLTARSVLYGLAASRLLGYVPAFAARSIEEFERQWQANHQLFSARHCIARMVFTCLIAQLPDTVSTSQEDQIDRLNKLDYEVFCALGEVEFYWKKHFTLGRIAELRSEGAAMIGDEGLGGDDVVGACASMLGWQ